MDSSFTQALFDDLINALSKDMIAANINFQKVLSNSNSIIETFNEALDDQQIYRITLYSACAIILVVSLSGILLVVRCLCKVHSKINKLKDSVSRSEEEIPLNITRHHSRLDWMKPTPQPLMALESI